MKPYQVYEAVRKLIEIEELKNTLQSFTNRFVGDLDSHHWLHAQASEVKDHIDVIPSCKHLLDKLIRELGAEKLREEQTTREDRITTFVRDFAGRVCANLINKQDCGTCLSCKAREALSEMEAS